MQHDPFYSRLEARFRGTREEIRARQSTYLPILSEILKNRQNPVLLDLGCGRGEWMEAVRDAGWQAEGIDLDAGMIAEAEAAGLSVELADLTDALRKRNDSSVSVITAFHVIEHLEFSSLQILAAEAYRVLEPGGLLILETPNPENITVGTASFYMDPTHRSPLPPDLTAFLTEQAGFAFSRVIRVNSLPTGDIPAQCSMVGLLYGVSPDYAVLAQKQGEPAVDLEPVIRDTGISLFAAASKFDQELQSVFHHMNLETRSRFDHLTSLFEDRSWEVKPQLSAHSEQLHAMQGDLLALTELMTLRHQNTLDELNLVYGSLSWKLTAPLRGANTLRRGITRRAAPASRAVLAGTVRHAVLFVSRRPWLKSTASRGINRIPGLRTWLKNLYLRAINPQNTMQNGYPDPLSPDAEAVYADLKSAIANHGKEENR